MKAVIEISQEQEHLKVELEEEKVQFPLGLIVERWLYFYFPLFASPTFVPQKNGETEALVKGNRVSFRPEFMEIIEYYNNYHGRSSAYTAFVNDLRYGTVPEDIELVLEGLIKSIRSTIKSMPMKYLGYSHYQDHYQVFQYQTKRYSPPKDGIDRDFLITQLDTFTFSRELHELFHFIGSFIAGENSILTTWAEFTVNADKTGRISLADTIEILKTEITETRDVREVRNYFVRQLEQNEDIVCVWSGKVITSLSKMDIDHLLPFSAWKNNDMWNLLPALSTVNGAKSDKIPSQKLLVTSKYRILNYWHDLQQNFGDVFTSQLRLGLAGNVPSDKLFQIAFEQLSQKCEYLSTIRGYEVFNLS